MTPELTPKDAEEAVFEAALQGFRAYWEMRPEARAAIDCDDREFMIRYAIKKLATDYGSSGGSRSTT